MKRDHFQCQSCLSKTKMLSVHHKHYISGCDPWEHPSKYLITLCQDCHENAETINFKKLWKRRLKLRLMENQELIPDLIIVKIIKLFGLKHT